MNADRNLSRRVLLKGLGLSVALPWLEAAHLWGGEFSKPSKRPPQRFACMFIGDGISPPQWWSKGDGDKMELGESLTVLAPYKDKLNVITACSINRPAVDMPSALAIFSRAWRSNGVV